MYALHCRQMPCGVESPFFVLILQYIDTFYDKTDVLEDLLPYFKLLETEDAVHIKNRFNERVRTLEEMEEEPPTPARPDGTPAINSHISNNQEE